MTAEADAEAEVIRRRYTVVFGAPPDETRTVPLHVLRRLLAIADRQREEYLAMGFEVDDPEAEADP